MGCVVMTKMAHEQLMVVHRQREQLVAELLNRENQERKLQDEIDRLRKEVSTLHWRLKGPRGRLASRFWQLAWRMGLTKKPRGKRK